MPCFAVAQAEGDSLSTSATAIAFDEVIVTAKRLPSTTALSSSSVTVLSSRQIEHAPAASLAHLLSAVSGFHIKDYGSSSGLKTITQRGLGPEHTLVLLNGMRVSNMQNSLVDLGLISADEISGLEVLHGGHSATFGADAVAGVVNIKTRPERYVHSVKTSTSVGSFGYSSVGIAGGTGFEAGGLRISFTEERGSEDFPFVFGAGSQAVSLRRSNADFASQTARLQSSILLSENLDLHVYGRTSGSGRGVAGLVVSRFSASVARQHDVDHILQIHLANRSQGMLSYRVGAQFHQMYQRYVDTRFFVGASYIDNYFKNTDMRIEPVLELRVGEESRLAFGGELATVIASGNSLPRAIRRNMQGAYIAADHAAIAGEGVLRKLYVQPSLRYDVTGTEGKHLSHFSPQIGMTAVFAEAGMFRPSIRASVSRNFRVPTFNELYYAGGGGIGNPDLLPERSTSIDAGAEIGFSLYGLHTIRATYFDISMQNRIVWVAAGGASVTPKNIRQIESRGVEFLYGWHSPEMRHSFSASYTFSSTRKVSADFPGDRNINTQVAYVPHEVASLAASIAEPVDSKVLAEIGGTLQSQLVGFRFTNEDNSSFLPSYVLFNGSLRARFRVSDFRLTAKCDVTNIFDISYQTIAAYPMPGRAYKASLTIEY